MTFSELGLSPEVLQAVNALGYTSPTPIQAKAIPIILAGDDVLAAAQAGTGKTAAFTLPLLTRLRAHANTSMSPAMHPVRALILTPTRELADQVAESVTQYGKQVALRSAVVFGGVSMAAQKEILRHGVEIVVATPGRLLDHIEQKNIALNRVEMLILDEADRMLDMGFILDIRRIMGMLPKNRQTLLFSATFAPEIKKLSNDFMHAPKLVEVARQNATSETIEQWVFAIDAQRKRALLVHLLKTRDMTQVIVFCRTKQSTENLARELKREGISADAIHGDRAQSQRLETLAAFKEGNIRVLVATDVAARGLDVEDLPFVVNFEMPNAPEDYVHRIGRTGRAGSKGVAITFMSEEEQKQREAIEELTKQSLPPQIEPRFWPSWIPRPAPAALEAATPSPRNTTAATPPVATAPVAAAREAVSPPTPARPTATARALAASTNPHLLSALNGRLANFGRTPREVPALLLPPRYP